ncbi:hypothetical protein COOONC_09372 [Cooperia oncophora]
MYASNSLMSSGPSGRSDVNAFYTHEKEDFRDLNSRLEHYISRVKGLERDNQELVNKLRHLHETWGQQNSEGKREECAELSVFIESDQLEEILIPGMAGSTYKYGSSR